MRDVLIVMALLAAVLAIVAFAGTLHSEWRRTSALAAIASAARESLIVVVRGIVGLSIIFGLYYGFVVAILFAWEHRPWPH